MEKMKKETVMHMCGLCGEKCLVDLDVQDGRIVSVRKAADRDGFTGNICVKGAALRQYIYNKDRLQHPMKRKGPKGSGVFEEISWEQAIKEISEKLLKIRKDYGPEAVVCYAGHPKWARRTISEFASVYGTPNYATESSTCNTAMLMAWQLVCGEWMKPDISHCDNLLVWAGNPAYSAQNYRQIINRVESGSMKMIVIDPRVTPMADKAYRHLQILPGTDGALALGLANVIINEGLEDRQYIEKYASGYEEYKEYVKEFTPERTAKITGISAEEIKETARIIAKGRTALHTSSCAIVDCVNGVQNLRAECMLLALTGNLDAEGGNLVSDKPAAMLDDNHKKLYPRPDMEHDIAHDRYPVWNICVKNEAQCLGLADNILEQKPRPIKGFIGFGVNTGMWPRPDKMIEALKSTELTVVTELFRNEACEAADYVLPACAFPENDWVYVSPEGQLAYLPKVIDPGDKKNDVEIILALARGMHMEGEFLSLPDWDAYLEKALKTTGVSLSRLKKEKSLKAENFVSVKKFSLEKGLNTPSGKIEFVSSVMKEYADMPGHDPLPKYTDWRDMVQEKEKEKYPYILCTGARKPQLFHSRTYRLKWISDLETHTTADISPEDAGKLKVKEGDSMRLSTPAGSMVFSTHIDPGVKQGVVHVYHDDPAMNINYILPDDYTDPVSGFPGFHSYVCGLEKEGWS